MSKLAIRGGKPVRSTPFPQGHIYGEREKELLEEVLKSPAWGGFAPTYKEVSPKCREFEERFAEFQGAKYCITCANGTVAIEIALRAIAIEAGDEVIVPASCSGVWITPEAVVEVNAVPVFVDVDPKTQCMDSDQIEAAITERTKAIMPIHWGGTMAHMDKIIDIAEKHSLVVIEDAAHTQGAKWKNRGAGSIGLLGIFSFENSKILTAGEGGCIITSDGELREKCRTITCCGRLLSDYIELKEPVLGPNFRMNSWQAAVLIAQLERLPEQNKRKSENAQFLTTRLKEIKGIEPKETYPEQTVVTYYFYSFMYEPSEFGGVSPEEFLKALKAELAGIGCNIETCSVHKKPWVNLNARVFTHACKEVRDKLNYSDVKCPVAERNNVVNLDGKVLLASKDDMEDIVKAIIKIKENYTELQ